MQDLYQTIVLLLRDEIERGGQSSLRNLRAPPDIPNISIPGKDSSSPYSPCNDPLSIPYTAAMTIPSSRSIPPHDLLPARPPEREKSECTKSS